MERRAAYKWESFTYRQYNDEAVAKFREWITWHDWVEVRSEVNAGAKGEAYQRVIMWAKDKFFPLRTVHKKSSDPSSMDKRKAKMIEDRKRLYVEEGGRTAVWKLEKKRTGDRIKERKRKFFDKQKESLLAEDANRNFYKHVKNFDLMPDSQSDTKTAEDLANYFNCISCEFDPLMPGEVPCTRGRELPVLDVYEVAARIRKFRKPKSAVPGDIFPQLVTQFADFLAVPLSDIYNAITESKEWPICWKK